MSVCLAVAETEPHVMLCRNTGTSCLWGALLTSCKAVHWIQPDRTAHKVCKQTKRRFFGCLLQIPSMDLARRTLAPGTVCPYENAHLHEALFSRHSIWRVDMVLEGMLEG